MKKILIITMILLVASMQLAGAIAGGQSDCPDADSLQYKIEYPEFDFGNTFVGDNITVDVLDSSDNVVGQVYVEITDVKTDGEAMAFDWTSTIPVCYINVKAGDDGDNGYNVGGQLSGSGAVARYDDYVAGDDSANSISHISFCFGCGSSTDVPEFPTLAIPIAAIIGLAFVMQRRKE